MLGQAIRKAIDEKRTVNIVLMRSVPAHPTTQNFLLAFLEVKVYEIALGSCFDTLIESLPATVIGVTLKDLAGYLNGTVELGAASLVPAIIVFVLCFLLGCFIGSKAKKHLEKEIQKKLDEAKEIEKKEFNEI